MFFLQFAIHFDDFAKAAGMPYWNALYWKKQK